MGAWLPAARAQLLGALVAVARCRQSMGTARRRLHAGACEHMGAHCLHAPRGAAQRSAASSGSSCSLELEHVVMSPGTMAAARPISAAAAMSASSTRRPRAGGLLHAIARAAAVARAAAYCPWGPARPPAPPGCGSSRGSCRLLRPLLAVSVLGAQMGSGRARSCAFGASGDARRASFAPPDYPGAPDQLRRPCNIVSCPNMC